LDQVLANAEKLEGLSMNISKQSMITAPSFQTMLDSIWVRFSEGHLNLTKLSDPAIMCPSALTTQ